MNKKLICKVQFVLAGLIALVGLYLVDGFLVQWKNIDTGGAIFWYGLAIIGIAMFVFLDALYKLSE